MSNDAKLRGERLPRAMVGAALAGVMALSLFLSLYQLQTIPPGLHHDEAYYALDAMRVNSEGIHPVFFEKNNGREPLFIYLLALAFRFVEPSAYSARVVSALISVLTLPALFLLVREGLQARDARLAEAAGLLSALLLGTLYWHVNYSRLALRAVTFPLLEALALWLFWRALRLRRAGDFIAAGVCLGISMYSYLAARLLVPMLGLFILLLAIEERGFLKRQWKGLLWLFGMALIVSLPLWAYFAQHPEFFIYRVQQITLDNRLAVAGSRQDLGSNLLRTLLMFTTEGDWGWPNNLPGRPVFDAVGIAGFLLGLVAVALQFRRTRALQWPLWIAVMTLPVAITVYPPNYTRSIGATVPIATLAGIGLAEVWWFVGRRLPRPALSTWLLALLLAGAAGYTGYRTFSDYFWNWARQPELGVYFNVDVALAAKQILAMPSGSRAYVAFTEPDPYESSLDFEIQRQRFVRPPAVPKTYELRWHNHNCLIVPTQQDRMSAYLMPPAGETFAPTLRQIFAGRSQVKGPFLDREGHPYFTEVLVNAPATPQAVTLQPERPATYTLGDSLTFLGSSAIPATLRAGETLTMTLYWRVDAPLAGDETIFAQFIGRQFNAQGNPVWGQWDEMPCQGTFPTSVWEPGTYMLTRYAVPLAGDAPAGRYQLKAGLYDARRGERMSVRDAAGQPVVDNSIPLAEVEVR